MNRIMKRAAPGAVAVAIAAIAGISAPQTASAQEVTLRLHNFNSPKAIANRLFMMPWAEQLEKDTGGRLKVEVYPAMQLGGKPSDLYSQARDGVVDIVWTLPGYSSGRFPLTEVYELPYVAGDDAISTSQAFTAYAKEWLIEEEYSDTHPLVFHTTAPGHIHTVDTPIRKLEDLEGVKIRGHSRINAETLRALGAVPVGMPVPKVYEAISRGVVEGTWIPWTIMRPFRITEVTNFHTELSISPALFLMTMNKQSYQDLPADLREAIDDSTGLPLAERLGRMWQEDEKPGRAVAVEQGDTIIQLSDEEHERWRKALQPVIDGWIEKVDEMGHDGEERVEAARKMVEKYSN